MQTAPLQSLAGVRILITRPKRENQTLARKLRAHGAVTFELPTIEVVPPADTRLLDAAIGELPKYDWIIFTSVQGVRFFHERMNALGQPTESLYGSKIAAIGPATARELKKLGKKPDFVPAEFLSKQIARGLGSVEGKRILLPRADIASKELPGLLKNQGAVVEEVVGYRTIVPTDLSGDRLQSILNQGVDVVTFTSPSTVRNLAKIAGAESLEGLLKDVKIACIGPVTAEAARELGIHVDIVARNHTVDDLVEAIVNEIRNV